MQEAEVINHYRRELTDYSRRSFARGLISGTGGNLSLRIPGTDLVLITPTGVSLADVEPAANVMVNLNGDLIESPLGIKASKETGFHLSAYRLRPDVNAIAHLHPPHATAWSTTGLPLRLPTISSRLILKNVPCVPCFNPGSRELSDAITKALADYPDVKALLLSEHGLMAMGPTMSAAYYIADLVEATAHMGFLAAAAKDLVG